MNLILLESREIGRPLPLEDPRSRHILQVLRRRVGDQVDVGWVDGPRGKATLRAVGPQGLELAFQWGGPEPAPDDLTLLVGLCRPQTNRKILREASAMGVCRMLFVRTERGETGYAKSRLWTRGEYRRHLLEGTAQAFTTRLPSVRFGLSLAEALADPELGGIVQRVALDNYEYSRPLAGMPWEQGSGVVLAVGSERGWTGEERNHLRRAGFVLARLGARVLRTETAVVAGLALIKAGIGAW